MRGLLDKISSHLALVGSVADADGVLFVVVEIVIVTVAVDVVILVGERFEWPLELLYMYLLSLPLLLLCF